MFDGKGEDTGVFPSRRGIAGWDDQGLREKREKFHVLYLLHWNFRFFIEKHLDLEVRRKAEFECIKRP